MTHFEVGTDYNYERGLKASRKQKINDVIAIWQLVTLTWELIEGALSLGGCNPKLGEPHEHRRLSCFIAGYIYFLYLVSLL